MDKFDDTYLSGSPVDQIVLGTVIKWSLPNGDRICTTLADYNRNFPFIFQQEEKWKNAMNLRKRQRLGLTGAEAQELAAFEAKRREAGARE